MNKSTLKKYAKLIVKMGVNVKKNQSVIINASIEAAPLVTAVVEECYKAKAKEVEVQWSNQDVTRLNYTYKTLETLSEYKDWQLEKLKHYSEVLPAMIHIISDDPDGLVGIDMAKVAKARQNTYPITKPYSDKRDSKYQWTIVGYPGLAWAKKVFPNDKPSVALKKLEKAILDVTRVNTKNPIEEWKLHNERIASRCEKLNNYNFEYLTYKSNNGTNFKVYLADNHQWCGGAGKVLGKNIWYNANMPSEEVFTMPHKDKCEGIVYSTKPLSYNGQLIEDFSLEFKDGKVVKCDAKKGLDALERMISMDEGAKMLGEVALVEVTSPINLTNILFYNTLYDENASCHLALGRAYTDNIKDFDKKSEEELKACGKNDSMIHVDFMIGSDSLEIIGYTHDGTAVKVFENGVFVI